MANFIIITLFLIIIALSAFYLLSLSRIRFIIRAYFNWYISKPWHRIRNKYKKPTIKTHSLRRTYKLSERIEHSSKPPIIITADKTDKYVCRNLDIGEEVVDEEQLVGFYLKRPEAHVTWRD